jgi:hypothetical protein
MYVCICVHICICHVCMYVYYVCDQYTVAEGINNKYDNCTYSTSHIYIYWGYTYTCSTCVHMSCVLYVVYESYMYIMYVGKLNN